MATRRHGAARGVVGGLLEGPARPQGHRSRRPLGRYGFVATFQPDPHFGRILAAYGGVFVAGSLAWGMLVDDFRPDRYDLLGAGLCLAGVAVIMYAPRAS
jgi:drug/metabolite transporter superfamily protein YnfA